LAEREADGTFAKGHSGNPHGRPPAIGRKMAEGLQKVGQLPYFDEDFTNAQAVARMIWIGLLDGVIPMNGTRMALTTKDWLNLVKWLYTHLDGSLHRAAPLGEEELKEVLDRAAEKVEQGEVRGIVKEIEAAVLSAEELAENEEEQNKLALMRNAAYDGTPIRKRMPPPTMDEA